MLPAHPTLVLLMTCSPCMLQVMQDALPTGLAENHVRFIFDSVVASVEWLHGRGYVHHDLKPSNLCRYEPLIVAG